MGTRVPVVGNVVQVKKAWRIRGHAYSPERRWNEWVAAIVLYVSDSMIEVYTMPSRSTSCAECVTPRDELVWLKDHDAAEDAAPGSWRFVEEAGG